MVQWWVSGLLVNIRYTYQLKVLIIYMEYPGARRAGTIHGSHVEVSFIRPQAVHVDGTVKLGFPAAAWIILLNSNGEDEVQRSEGGDTLHGSFVDVSYIRYTFRNPEGFLAYSFRLQPARPLRAMVMSAFSSARPFAESLSQCHALQE